MKRLVSLRFFTAIMSWAILLAAAGCDNLQDPGSFNKGPGNESPVDPGNGNGGTGNSGNSDSEFFEDGPGSGGQGPAKTASISYIDTNNTVELDRTAYAQGAWKLTAYETETVYFAAGKTAAQTITVNGTNAGAVTMYDSGEADGATAGDAKVIFKVASGIENIAFDTKESNFTLTVSEDGKDSLTVPVTLTVQPDLTGVAVFKVTRETGDSRPEPNINAISTDDIVARHNAWVARGKLTRVPAQDVKKWNNTGLGGTWTVDADAAGNNLIDALAFVEHDTSGTTNEYLIRVEADQIIPMTILTVTRDITIRIAGYGEERIIKYNGDTVLSYAYFDKNFVVNATTKAFGFISVGINTNTSSTTLELGNNITISGNKEELAPTATSLPGFVYVGKRCKLIMLEGSKLTGFRSKSAQMNSGVVNVYSSSTATDVGRFYMYGGDITDNVILQASTVGTYYNNALIKLGNQTTPAGRFVKAGGSIDTTTENRNRFPLGVINPLLIALSASTASNSNANTSLVVGSNYNDDEPCICSNVF